MLYNNMPTQCHVLPYFSISFRRGMKVKFILFLCATGMKVLFYR
jgi:hypothetical protein